MIKRAFILCCFIFLLFSCDIRKSSVNGKVVNKSTGLGVDNVLVNFIECKTNGENCSEVVIGQIYTSTSGEFIITEKMASKTKTKWLTVTKNGKKLAQKDNVGLNDKNLIIEVEP